MKRKTRCMTCDELMAEAPLFMPLSDCESIGVCRRCVVVIRTFTTLEADAQTEYRRSRGKDGWVTYLSADAEHRVHHDYEPLLVEEGCPRETRRPRKTARKPARKVTRKASAPRGRKP